MIEVSHLTKTFGSTKAVDNVSFSIQKGEIVGLLGPNGAGKTTIMRTLTGYYAPNTGTVKVNGHSYTNNPDVYREYIGYLPENNPLYPDALVSEHLHFSGKLYGLEGKMLDDSIAYVVDAVDIGNYYYRPTKELSKGYKQRVGMAMALLHNPDILILDEPSEGLDPNQRTTIRGLIQSLAKDHTVILSTHVLQEVSATCNRILILNNGELVADRTVEELGANQQGKEVVSLTLSGNGVVDILNRHSYLQVLDHKQDDNRYTISISLHDDRRDADLAQVVSELIHQHKWVIREMSLQQHSLEDVFREITQSIE